MALEDHITLPAAQTIRLLGQFRRNLDTVEPACVRLAARFNKDRRSELVLDLYRRRFTQVEFAGAVDFAAELNADWSLAAINAAYDMLLPGVTATQWGQLCGAFSGQHANGQNPRQLITLNTWSLAERILIARAYSANPFGMSIQEWSFIAAALTGLKARANVVVACARQVGWTAANRLALAAAMDASAGAIDIALWGDLAARLTGANATADVAAVFIEAAGPDNPRKLALAGFFNADAPTLVPGVAPARPPEDWVIVEMALAAQRNAQNVRAFSSVSDQWTTTRLGALVTAFAANQRGRTSAVWVAVANVLTGARAAAANVDGFVGCVTVPPLTPQNLVHIATRFDAAPHEGAAEEWATYARKYAMDLDRTERHMHFRQAGWPRTILLNGHQYTLKVLDEVDGLMYSAPPGVATNPHVTIHALHLGVLPPAGRLKGPNGWKAAGQDFHVVTETRVALPGGGHRIDKGLFDYQGATYTVWEGKGARPGPGPDVRAIAADFWRNM